MQRVAWMSVLGVIWGLLGCPEAPLAPPVPRSEASTRDEGRTSLPASPAPSEGEGAVALVSGRFLPGWLREAERRAVPTVPSGIGELRAHRPGERERRQRRLRLLGQQVRVRIAGPMAVTEVEQTFRNEESVQLEGVYRFVLPAGARLRALALQVGDRWERGAIVSKERAERIWRRVVRNATSRSMPSPGSWIRGSWRDPAMLHWSRGGRVELRIFPIPARGVRKVRLVYEEHLRLEGGERRYRFQLPASADARMRIDDFRFELRVGRLSEAPRSEGAVQLHVEQEGSADWVARFSSRHFAPRGVVALRWREPMRREVRWWVHDGSQVALAPDPESREDEGILLAQRNWSQDRRPYVLFALRPDWLLGASGEPLARSEEESDAAGRDVILWLDGSQSMMGARWQRAIWSAAALAASLSARDRVSVVSCDFVCRAWSAGHVPGGRDAAEAVRSFGESFEPAGWSDFIGPLHWFARMARRKRWGKDGRNVHLVYLGDGVGTVGPTRGETLEHALRSAWGARPRWRIHAVAVGLEADRFGLGTLVRIGGGRLVDYSPGRSLSEVTAELREAMDGALVRDVEVSFGGCMLEDTAPRRLPNLLVGEEVLLAARWSLDRVDCVTRKQMTVEGTLDGRRVRRVYDLAPLYEARRARRPREAPFVARQWAAAYLRDLEASFFWRSEAIALSRAFGILGRDTSLLVLEHPAMFRAFGVGRGTLHVLDWAEEADDASGDAGGVAPESIGRASPRRRSRFVSRTRLFVRHGLLSREARRAEQRVKEAEEALGEHPDSLDRLRDLVRALARAGDLTRAEEAARRWLRRDPMDPEALTYLADVVGRQGRRTQAVRLLTGIVDLAPESAPAMARLARGFARGPWHVPACLAWFRLWEMVRWEAQRVPRGLGKHEVLMRAKRCSSLLSAAKGRLGSGAPDLVGVPPLRSERQGRGRPALRIEASWQSEDGAGEDLDVSLITPQGTRIWWLGGRHTVFGGEGAQSGRERLGLRHLSPGVYRLEVVRLADPRPMRPLAPVRGTVQIVSKHAGSRRVVRPFELAAEPGARVQVATLVVRR